MKRGGVPLVARTGARVFGKKWPGFITAFDGLFRAASKDELSQRLRDFYAAAASDERGRQAAFQRLGDTLGMDAGDHARLLDLGTQAVRQGLAFEADRLKRTLSGSSDNAERWYPSNGLTSWTYYEPRLLVPRNDNEGRERGWGSMSQWRAPESHVISPKLVFTTASDPRRGFKAFVLRDEWYVKIHGGARQQYHYTASEDPLQPQRLGGSPNNLSIEALELFEYFISRGLSSEDFLLYCAGVYNSDYAFEFLSENGGDTLPIPLNRPDRAVGIAAVARRLRDLTYLRVAFTAAEAINVSETPYDVGGLAVEAGFEQRSIGGGRFQPDVTLVRLAGTLDTISGLIALGQDTLNTEIATLFGLGALAEPE